MIIDLKLFSQYVKELFLTYKDCAPEREGAWSLLEASEQVTMDDQGFNVSAFCTIDKSGHLLSNHFTRKSEGYRY